MVKYFDNLLISLLSAPFIAGAVFIYSVSLVEFKPEISAQENELFRFQHTSTNVIFKKYPIVVTGFLKSPVGINIKKKAKVIKLDSSGVPQAKEKKVKVIPKKLTFIIINESRKMAIINSFILNEGDTVADSQVLRIEKDGVLINETGIGKKWLRIE